MNVHHCIAVLLVSGSFALAVTKPEEPNPPRFRHASIGVVINGLPSRANENVWNEEQRSLVPHPAVAELRRRLDRGRPLTDAQWRPALSLSDAIRSRRLWPVDESYAIGVRVPAWLGTASIELTPRAPGLHGAASATTQRGTCATFAASWTEREAYQELGRLPLGEHDLEFGVTVTREGGMYRVVGDGSPPPGVLWRGRISIPVRVVESAAEAQPSVQSDSLDQALAESIGWGHMSPEWHRDRVRKPVLLVQPSTDSVPELAGIGLSLRAELLNRGSVVQTHSLGPYCYELEEPHRFGNRTEEPRYAYRSFDGVPASAEQERSGWSIRITGTNEGLLRLWAADSYWSGTIELPLSEARALEVERHGSADRTGHWVGDCWE